MKPAPDDSPSAVPAHAAHPALACRRTDARLAGNVGPRRPTVKGRANDMKATRFIGAVFSVLLQAQSVPPAATPKFDVVSIKPCKPGVTKNERGGPTLVGGDSSPGRLSRSEEHT